MTFEKALNAQHELQIKSFGQDPKTLSDVEKLEWVRWNILALSDELHEALAETGWKPWAKSQHINRDAFVSELVDSFHFLMNLMLRLSFADVSWITLPERIKQSLKFILSKFFFLYFSLL